MNTVERYFQARARMGEGIPVPHHVLREYLDVTRHDKHAGNAASKALTITMDQSWFNQFPSVQRRDIVKAIFAVAQECGWTIRVKGQKWDA